jgi:flagellar biosynthesis protein FlhF
MEALLAVDAPVHKELLLSLTSSKEHLLATAARFDVMAYDRVIFTKLDECDRPGLLYDVAVQLGKPVSYVTTGQNVPRDIETMSPQKVARLVLAGMGPLLRDGVRPRGQCAYEA